MDRKDLAEIVKEKRVGPVVASDEDRERLAAEIRRRTKQSINTNQDTLDDLWEVIKQNDKKKFMYETAILVVSSLSLLVGVIGLVLTLLKYS